MKKKRTHHPRVALGGLRRLRCTRGSIPEPLRGKVIRGRTLCDTIMRMGSRRSRVRSIVTRVVVFLLLGAIVNVAVAWGSAVFVDWQNPPGRLFEHDASYSWPATPPRTYPPIATSMVEHVAPGVSVQVFSAQADTSKTIERTIQALRDGVLNEWAELVRARVSATQVGAPGKYGYLSIRCGWPLRAIEGGSFLWVTLQSYLFETDAPPVRNCMLALAVEISRDSSTGQWSVTWPHSPMAGWPPDKVVPLRPIWPGFAVNTLFYTAILWLFFVAPFALRRRRRIKRGLCPACAYPVGTSPVCTECGGPVLKAA